MCINVPGSLAALPTLTAGQTSPALRQRRGRRSLQVAAALLEAHPDNAQAWALLSMLFRAAPAAAAAATDVVNSAHKAQTLAEAARGDSAHSLTTQPYLQLEVLLLELQLGALAKAVHVHAEAQCGADAVRMALALCSAQSSSLTGDAAAAVAALTAASKEAGAVPCRPRVAAPALRGTCNRVMVICCDHQSPQCECHQNRSGCPCLLYTSPSPRDRTRSRMPSSA